MTEWLKTELRRVMAEKGLDAKGWSLAAGLSATYVRDILRDRSKRPAAEGLRKLATIANLDPGHFIRQQEAQLSDREDFLALNVRPAIDAPALPVFASLKQDVPLYGTAMGGSGDGDFVPAEGSPVRPALVKQLISVSGSKVKLGQYNPKAVIELDRRRVYRIYRVLEWDDLLKSVLSAAASSPHLLDLWLHPLDQRGTTPGGTSQKTIASRPVNSRVLWTISEGLIP